MSDLFVLIALVSVVYLVKYAMDKYKEYQKYKLDTISNFQRIKRNLDKKEEELNKKEEDIKRILNDNSQNASWLANRFIDYKEMQDNVFVDYLLHKDFPAKKAAQIVAEVSKEKRMYCYKAKILQYQLDYLLHIFPSLEDSMLINARELEEYINVINNNYNTKTEYETLKEWLSPEEYSKLSDTKKYQLALDRYLRSHKSAWQIGIAYERYIGYIYENKGYDVIANGALAGLQDMGRDIIAENSTEILIIQCKYWSQKKVIRENIIFQLYGTTILKKIELKNKNIRKKVKGILVTSTILSEIAKNIANELGIEIKENENFNKNYPCIKCNINKSTGERIYHLPFDQQYDTIKIIPSSGECYVSTVEEAEKLGFRRAKKYMFNKKSIK